MAEEEEEEIMAEEAPANGLAFSGFVSSVVSTIESYGWFILLGLIVAYAVWVKVLEPRWSDHRKQQTLAEAKKFDGAQLFERQQAIEEARMKLQQKYAEDARRVHEQAEEKRRQEIYEKSEEWERHKEGHGYKSKYHADAPKISTDVSQAAVRRTCGARVPQTDVPTDPREFVDTLISCKPVVVFSKTWCPFCNKAKQALSTYRLSPEVYQVVELDERTDGDAIQDVLNDITGRRSVPRVFIGGKCIGGGDETTAAHRSGQLEQMLKDCGAM